MTDDDARFRLPVSEVCFLAGLGGRTKGAPHPRSLSSTRRRAVCGWMRRTCSAVAKEVALLKVGDRSPALAVTSYDGWTVQLGAPGKRTVLWFSPKGGLVDELGDRLLPAWSP